MLYIGTSTCRPNTYYQIEYKNKNCKISSWIDATPIGNKLEATVIQT
jgi:hypothetical protein